ncbi:MAG: cation diffusion facilitator family transporter [Bacillota bacterium]
MDSKGKVSLLAIAANLLIMALQIAIGILAGSVAMISDGIHTVTDFMAAVGAWISVRVALRPEDACHPWGHGKYENLAALGQGVLILISAAIIGWEAVERLLAPAPLEIAGVGMAVTLVAIILQGLVSWRMWQVAKKTESLAVLGGALHMLTDVASSVAVLVGLAIAHFWGILIADAIAALAVTALIAAGGIKLIYSASLDLVDSSLPRAERESIEEIFTRHMPPLRGFHKLRTRRVGRFRYLEVHLLVDGALSVEQAHDICDHLEEHLRQTLPHSRSALHVEPDNL